MSFSHSYAQNFSTNFSDAVESERCRWTHFNTAITALLLFTFILNALASVVLFRVPLTTLRGRSNPVYFCIRFLNICDVLQAGFLTVMPAFATPECNWIGGDVSCSIMGFLALFFLLISPLITILMAFDRVVALYLPFKYRSQLGLKMLKILLPSSCVLVMVITMLPVFGIGQYHVVEGRRFCLLDTITDDLTDRRYVLAIHAIFLIALLFMLSCTAAIQSKLVLMSFTRRGKESKSKPRRRVSSRRTRNATLTAIAVCGIFVVCYMPYVVRVLIEAAKVEKSSTLITWITFALAFTQPLLNPVVCIGTNTRYRQELKALISNIKVTETEHSSESGFSTLPRRNSSKSGRDSRKLNKPQEPHVINSVCPYSPSSPQPYHGTNDTKDHCNPLLRSHTYASNGKHTNGHMDTLRSSYRYSNTASPRIIARHFELLSMNDVRSSNSSGENDRTHWRHSK